MKDGQTENLFRWMKTFVVKAGNIALKYRGRVKNIGKQYDLGKIGDIKAGTAKTIVDEIIQELFLSELYFKFPGININVEENTTILPLFSDHIAPDNRAFKHLTIHLDPVDGTKSYLEGKKEFTVGLAISNKDHQFTHTIIFAPVLNKVFSASPSGCSIYNKIGKHSSVIKEEGSRLIYEKRILSKRGRKEIEKLGFFIREPNSAHISIIYTALGKSAAFLYGGSNPHDSLIPYAFAKALGVEPTNVYGEKIQGSNLEFRKTNNYLKFERVPSICYFSCSTSQKNKIISIFAKKENLDQIYLKKFARREPR